MIVRILENCAVAGEHLAEGELVNLPDAEARSMNGMGRSREATTEEVAAALAADEAASKKNTSKKDKA